MTRNIDTTSGVVSLQARARSVLREKIRGFPFDPNRAYAKFLCRLEANTSGQNASTGIFNLVGFLLAMPKKIKAVLDWYGNPIPNDGLPFRKSGTTIKGELDEDGKKYLRFYGSDGRPGDRVALEDAYLRVTDAKTGKVLYDSRCEPPSDATLLPGYIGYHREKMLKRYFPE